MVASGYMSSTSFYVFLIITIVLIFILCISNIVAYANILKDDNIAFDHTWAKILIGMNAILIIIAFIILMVLILKFMKGRTKVATVGGTTSGSPSGGSTSGSSSMYGPMASRDLTLRDIYNAVPNWNQEITGLGEQDTFGNTSNCFSPYNTGCSRNLQCSDGTKNVPCPDITPNDRAINVLYNRYVSP